jgi:cell division inhibitor SulA
VGIDGLLGWRLQESKSLIFSVTTSIGAKLGLFTPKDNDHCFWLFWEALTEGNSHTVIGTPGTLTDQQMNRLESAALIGKCNALILRDRASYS